MSSPAARIIRAASPRLWDPAAVCLFIFGKFGRVFRQRHDVGEFGLVEFPIQGLRAPERKQHAEEDAKLDEQGFENEMGFDPARNIFICMIVPVRFPRPSGQAHQ